MKAIMLDSRFKKMYFDSPKQMKGNIPEEVMPFFDDSIASSEKKSFLNLLNKTIQLRNCESDNAEEKFW